MAKEEIEVYFAMRGASYRPVKLKAERITIGHIEFHAHDAYCYRTGQKLPGQKALSRNGLLITYYPKDEKDIVGYIMRGVRTKFPGENGKADRAAFGKAFLAHERQYAEIANRDREYYRDEARYLSRALGLKK